MRNDVEFKGAHGTILRGWLYLPDGRAADERVPGVVMAHGLSAVKEMALPRMAEVFCDAGLAVLVYDHRNLGASDGEPRQLVNPFAQARDYRHAVTFLCSQPEVDPSRIAVWGSSFSGGPAIVAAATDDRVTAVVANVPFAYAQGQEYTDAAAVNARFEAVKVALDDESGDGPADGGETFGPLLVVAEEEGQVPLLPEEEARVWFLDWKARDDADWINEIHLQAMTGEPVFDPGACAFNLHKPLLMVLATEERLAGLSRETYQEIFDGVPGPKRLEVVEGDHFTVYQDPGFQHGSTVMREFLVEQLLEAR